MPYVTGTSVLGLTYKDGVLIASDMLGELPVPMLHVEGVQETLLLSQVLEWQPLLLLVSCPHLHRSVRVHQALQVHTEGAKGERDHHHRRQRGDLRLPVHPGPAVGCGDG